MNRALRDPPRLATDDPYGRGWIRNVRVPNLPAQSRNLMEGQLARRRTEDAREQLELRLMALPGPETAGRQARSRPGTVLMSGDGP